MKEPQGLQVTVAAYSGTPSPEMVSTASVFVERLSILCPGSVLLLGGYRGLMKVVADKALELGLRVVFIIPRMYESDRFPRGSTVVRTGLGDRERSSILVRSGDALVSLGGGVGTFLEVLLACSYGLPVYYLKGLGDDMLLTERAAHCFPDGVLDPRLGCRIQYFDSASLMAEAVCGRRG